MKQATPNSRLQPWSLKVWALAILLKCGVLCEQSGAQGTIRFGFEEFAPGAVPGYVRKTYDPEFEPMVLENPPSYPPFEGSKVLFGAGNIALASPDGQLITGFTLYYFAGFESWSDADPRTYRFGIGTLSGDAYATAGPGDWGHWTKASASLSTPVKELAISGFSNIGQTFPFGYAIDAVEFHTVPEPGITALIAVGLIAVLGATWRKRRISFAKRLP